MKKLTMFIAFAVAGLMVVAPAEARKHHKKKKHACTACAKPKCGCAPDSGYRSAAWGGSYFHTSEGCKAVAEIPKDKLIVGEAATFGRKRHCCCGGHA